MASIPAALAAQPLRPSAAAAARRLEKAAGGPVKVVASPATGLAIFLTVEEGRGIPLKGLTSARAEDRAAAFLEDYGELFGISETSQTRVLRASKADEVGMEHVRIQQLHGGVPVTAGELVIHFRGADVVAANGETLPDLDGLETLPGLGPEAAAEIVRGLLEKHLGVTGATFAEPRLEILNRGLLEEGRFATRLAWYVEARGAALRERLWIDAETGGVLLQFSQLARARTRSIYDAASGSSLPGTLVRSEGGPATGDADADAAYEYSGDTWEYFWFQHGRDSYDGAGAALVSSVDFCPNPPQCPYANAFWNGVQMVYGDGFPAADDVAAHELTHAVTEFSADLFYYQQSGALNESFSDIFGETVDLINGAGTDTPGVRWSVGEDVPGFGAFRNMMDPTVFDDPGKPSDPQFVCAGPGGDSGGVHSNSGVPNHAFALMADGGSYNGFDVTALGLNKAAKIEYRALTHYLVSGSGFLDDYYALQQACTDLIGVAGISSADCQEVRDAVDAVELWYYWRCSPALQWRSEPCADEGGPVATAFFDDLEAGADHWLVSFAGGSSNAWYRASLFATSATHHLYGQELKVANDAWVSNWPPIVLPNDAELHFEHAFGFENSGVTYYDGGVVEYSTDGGLDWTDAGPLFEDPGAAYNGTLSACCSNPLAGRTAFVGDSYGYTTSRLNLKSLVGRPFQVRFRFATDAGGGDYGWFIDDVGIYQCLPEAIFSDGFASGDTSRWTSAIP